MIWCFGDSALIDFNSGTPQCGTSALNAYGSCCSISDQNGQLLFYCGTPEFPVGSALHGNGVVYNSLHQVMDSGEYIESDRWYHELVIIPILNDSLKYYLFHQNIGAQGRQGLYYSIVDLHFNAGLGRVTQKNTQLVSSYMIDCLAAIKHGNGRDWWLITRRNPWVITGTYDNRYYYYLVTPFGIQNYGFQSIGNLNEGGLGEIKFNLTGNRMVFINIYGQVELYDFDRCTGLLSNPLTIEQLTTSAPEAYWGVEFSQEDQRLYVVVNTPQDNWTLRQYDLTAANITQSKVDIYTQVTTPYACGGGALKLAPDGKIYWAFNMPCVFPYIDTSYSSINKYLSVIENPIGLGASCDFRPFSFYLGGKRTYMGLPNNPDYNLPAVSGSVCDSLNPVNGVHLVPTSQNIFEIHPNPSSGAIHISGAFDDGDVIEILDLSGRMIFKEKMNGSSIETTLAAGSYLVKMAKSEGNIQVKKLIVL